MKFFLRPAGPAILAALALFAAPSPCPADDFERLTRQYQQHVLGGSSSGASRSDTSVVRSLRPDGSWADVDYRDDTRGGWRTYNHLGRVLSMVKAYKTPETAPEAKAALQPAIHRALGYWLKHDFQNPNWWYNVIGVPQTTADIAILMQGELTPEEFDIMANRILPRGKIGMTGQNRVWVASITLVRGLVLKNRSLVDEAARVLGEEICVTTSEGVQLDYSFHQHGPQQQFGNYGLSFAVSAASWMQVFQGTPFAFSREKLNLVHDYLVQGENWVVWRGRMDLSSCGRQLSEGSQEAKGRGVARAMEIMSRVDLARAADYQAFLRRNAPGGANDLLGNRYFWRSDYMIQRGTNYYASVKMSSRRVIGAELVNSENISGLHLGDGALYLEISGDEYEDIQPVWDWQKLPGTTCAQLKNWPVKFGRSQVQTDFAGGVSDGHTGCAALDFKRDGVQARKAWFFMDGAVACLGAGISSTNTVPVTTTVNQCWLKGEVTAAASSEVQKLARGDHELKQLRWVWHNGVGYLFPQGSDFRMHLGEQRGDWRKVEDKRIVSNREVAGDVLLITQEHGTRPANQTCAWVMVPNARLAEMAAQAQSPAIRILSNTTGLQAVASADGQRAQAVFYSAGKLELGPSQTMAVDQPCLVLVDLSGTQPRMCVAEPTQKLASLNVSLNGRDRPVKLPTGSNAGQSVVVD